MSPALFEDFDYIMPVVVREWSRYPVTRPCKKEIAYSKSDAFPCSRSEVAKRNGKERVQFSSKKVLLELRKDRSSSRTISTSTTDQSSSSDDEVELKKKIEIESTDEEDFNAYCEEIRKMAPAVTEKATSSSGFESPSFAPSHSMSSLDQIFVNFCMAEFTSEFSSPAIDTSEFFRLEAYKKIVEFVKKEKRIRKDEKEQKMKKIEEEHDSMIASKIIKMVIRI